MTHTHALRSLKLHGNPLSAELKRGGRPPLVLLRDDALTWVNVGLTTDELEQRLLALTDAQCARVTKYVAVCEGAFLAQLTRRLAGCIATATS